MQEQLVHYLQLYEGYAVFLSIVLNIVISVLGIVPSFFITGANIAFFGFWNGMMISMLGEILGAGTAFYLYRKGLSKVSATLLEKHEKVKSLVCSEGREAFFLILLLRVVPFVPSGLVTFAGAVGKVSFLVFLAASSLGKIPALFIEAVSVYQVLKISWVGEMLFEIGLVITIYCLWKIQRRR